MEGIIVFQPDAGSRFFHPDDYRVAVRAGYKPGKEATMKYYAGIGSRKTPHDTCDLMTKIAIALDNRGYILRSGGAKGADKAFEAGSDTQEIYKANDAQGDTAAHVMAALYHVPAWTCKAIHMYGRRDDGGQGSES